MYPQRGSARESKCYSVPYSEHSSFRELTMFCCALNVGKIIPTVKYFSCSLPYLPLSVTDGKGCSIGSAASRDKMHGWFERWEAEKRKNGLFKIEDGEF